MLAIWPVMGIPALCALGVWAITLAATRIMAMASILGAMTITVMLVIQGLTYSMGSSPAPILPYMAISVALLLFVIYTHRSNITRILRGSEMKV